MNVLAPKNSRNFFSTAVIPSALRMFLLYEVS
jgi:hypothetical protein